MNIKERAASIAKAASAVLQVEPNEEQLKLLTDLIEQAVINAMLEAGERHTSVVMQCCSPDLDKAHKVADEIRRGDQALIANLQAMR